MMLDTRSRVTSRRVALVRMLVSCALVTVSLTACTAVGSARPTATSAAAAEDRTIEFHQNRDQYANGAAIVRVGNAGARDLVIDGLDLSGPAFSGTTTRDRSSTVPAGQTRDLAVELPPIDCDAVDGQPEVDVLLRLADGRTLSAAALPDPQAALERIRDATCTVEAVQRIAEVTAVPGIRLEGSGPSTVAVLTVRVVPSGAPGTLELVSLRGTVLLRPAPTADGADGADEWPLGLTVDAASSPQTLELRIVPTRCDPHALAEDKVGTLFPLVVRVDGGPESVMTLPLDLDTAEALKDAVRVRCA